MKINGWFKETRVLYTAFFEKEYISKMYRENSQSQ